jgi:hypothetical protein
MNVDNIIIQYYYIVIVYIYTITILVVSNLQSKNYKYNYI